MRRIAMTLILVLGLGFLLSGCAFNRHLIVMDEKGNVKKEQTIWGDNTIAIIGKDGSVTFYNDRFPYPGNYSEKVTNPDGTEVNRHGSYPGYGYGHGYGYGYGYGYSGYGYDYGHGYYGYGSITPGYHPKPKPGYNGLNPNCRPGY